MISFASYNKYNNNILHDTIAVSSVNFLTSMLVGIFSFATIGNIAYEHGTAISEVVNDGPGMIFVVSLYELLNSIPFLIHQNFRFILKHFHECLHPSCGQFYSS
jgi:SNF family Na+-dependent transporter